MAEGLPAHLEAKDPGVDVSWAGGEEDEHGGSSGDKEQRGIAAHGCDCKETSSSEEERVPRRDQMPSGWLFGETGA